MKILQVLNSPNWSGASFYCISLCEKLRERGHDVLLLTEPGKPLQQALDAGVPCDDGIRLNHRNPGLYVQAMGRMKRIFRRFQPDIISCHINEGAWMAGMISRWFYPEAVVVRTRTDIDPPKGHFINRFVHHRWTDHVIVGSQLHKRVCHRLLNTSEEAIDVVYGAGDVDRFTPGADNRADVRRQFGLADDVVTLGLVARLDPVKGHEYAFAAIRLLQEQGVSVHLFLTGYENRRTVSWVEDQLRERRITSAVTWLGFRDELPELMRGLDIGLIASIGSEANSRACLEFMASGLPVVGTRVGVIPELLADGEHGFLAEPKDPVSLAEAIAHLARNRILRQKFGAQARQRVIRNFSLDTFVRNTENAYLRALSRKKRTVP